MPNTEKDYYYVGGKKIKLNLIPDSFAVRYKKDITSRAMGMKLSENTDFADAEECKEMPGHRLVIVTLPPSKRLVDMKDSVKSVEDDPEVDFVTSVYREASTGFRLIATDEITVRFKSDISQEKIEQFNEDNGVEIIEKNPYVQNQYLLRVKNPKDTLVVANKYQESGLTVFASPNFASEFRKAALPNDMYVNEQWHLNNLGQDGGVIGEDVRAMKAWDITNGSPDIVIAILDDGVDGDHPDLQANVIKGWNFFDNNDDPRPRKFTPPYHLMAGNDSHGTPCAGVAAAVGDNNIGVAGIAFRCKILPIKVFLADEMVTPNILANAIHYAGQKADVLSNSWETAPHDDIAYAIKDVVQTGRDGKGSPVFVAAGNESNSVIGFPASVPEAIAVGASTNLSKRADYSNYGEGLDFVAPSSGGTKGIFTTDVSIKGRGFNVGDINKGDAEGLYTNSFGGTSSATPLAAGVAALMLSKNPELTWDQVRKYMQQSTDKIDQANANYVNGYSLQYGYGRINANEALKLSQGVIPGEIIEKQVTSGLKIPDNDLKGIISSIDIDGEGSIDVVKEVSVNISHTYRGDLLVSLITPSNEIIKLHEGEGGRAQDLIMVYDVGSIPALNQLSGKDVQGKWMLKIVDKARRDTGTLNSWGLKVRILKKGNIEQASASPGTYIPDDKPEGIKSTLNFSAHGQIKDIKVNVDISHTYIGDLTVNLMSPSGKTVSLHDRWGGGEDNLQIEYNTTLSPQLKDFIDDEINGQWTLMVSDHAGMDVGKLNKWGIEVNL